MTADMFEDSMAEDWDLGWFCEPFAGSRGGLDVFLPTAEDFEQLLEVAAERQVAPATGHGSGPRGGSA